MSTIFGRLGLVTEDEAAEHARKVRAARVEVARENRAWTEIDPAERLVARGPGGKTLVDEESDLPYRLFRGAVFGTGASIEFVDRDRPLAFYVRGGEVTFLEQVGDQRWSQIIAARESRRLGLDTRRRRVKR